MIVTGLILLLTVIGFGNHADAISAKNKELQLLHVIFRHGIRTPADTFPTDPYINATFSPFGWGQLTNDGKLQMYEIGKYLRRRYKKFLGSQYDPKKFYVQTTDVDRTKMSAQLINAGLWPPKGEQIWGPLEWQPIPVNSEPLSTDSLLLVRRPCAQYQIEFDRVLQKSRIKKIFAANRKLFEDLSRITGKSITSPNDVQDIYSTLKAEDSFGLTLPKWIRRYYPDKLLPLTEFSYVLNAYNDKLNRLKGGVLLKKLLQDWKSKQAGTSEMRAILYGGHDSTISNILSTLNVWDEQVPGYGITILFEMSRNIQNNQFGLEIYLKNETDSEPYQLQIPNCGKFCSLEKLVKLTEPVVPVNWDEECKSDDPNYTPPPPAGP